MDSATAESVRRSAEHRCHAGMADQGLEGKDGHDRIQAHVDMFDSNEMQWASCCCVLFGGCNACVCGFEGKNSRQKSKHYYPPKMKQSLVFWWGGTVPRLHTSMTNGVWRGGDMLTIELKIRV